MDDRAVLKETLDIAKKSLAILEEQAAGCGKLQIPDRLRIDLEEKRRQVARLEAKLKDNYKLAIVEERESDFLTSEEREDELEDELKWDTQFANSQDLLAELAAEAMAEYLAGQTQALNPETL